MEKILEIYQTFADELEKIKIDDFVIYNPLKYNFSSFCQYVKLFDKCKTVFIGINPSINGMCQTSVPFGDVFFVQNYLKIDKIDINYELLDNLQKTKIKGFSFPKREISGKRLWGSISQKYDRDYFFQNNAVLNYCPLCFIKDNKNVTPDKLQKSIREEILLICNRYNYEIFELLNPKNIIGIGNFSFDIFKKMYPYKNILKLTHPSPLNPHAANLGFEKNLFQIFEQIEI